MVEGRERRGRTPTRRAAPREGGLRSVAKVGASKSPANKTPTKSPAKKRAAKSPAAKATPDKSPSMPRALGCSNSRCLVSGAALLTSTSHRFRRLTHHTAEGLAKGRSKGRSKGRRDQARYAVCARGALCPRLCWRAVLLLRQVIAMFPTPRHIPRAVYGDARLGHRLSV